MTGLLQNDRNTNDFKVWFKHDIEYRKLEFLFRLKNFIKTIPSLFNKSVRKISSFKKTFPLSHKRFL